MHHCRAYHKEQERFFDVYKLEVSDGKRYIFERVKGMMLMSCPPQPMLFRYELGEDVEILYDKE